MNIKEFAEMLNGREYGKEISPREAMDAREAGLVIVCGASDDLMEFCGAIHDEVGCYCGGKAYLTENELYFGGCSDGECDDECPSNDDDECYCVKEKRAKCKTIEAVWCGDKGYTWHYETDIPHETFDIYEDGEKFCRGIVFSIDSLKQNKELLSAKTNIKNTS